MELNLMETMMNQWFEEEKEPEKKMKMKNANHVIPKSSKNCFHL